MNQPVKWNGIQYKVCSSNEGLLPYLQLVSQVVYSG